MPKPTSRFGKADDNGVYRWEYGFLWWPDIRLLVTKYRRDGEKAALGMARYTCPLEVIQHADYALCCLNQHVSFDEDDFYRPSCWPRTFEVFKSRYDGSIGHKQIMSMLDFRLMLIR